MACGVGALWLTLIGCTSVQDPAVTVTFDMSREFVESTQIGNEVLAHCVTTERVRVEVHIGGEEITSTFGCAELQQTGPSVVVDALVARARHIHDAGPRADRIFVLQRALGADYFHDDDGVDGVDGVTWGLATSNGAGFCARARDPEMVALNLGAGMRAGETAEHWAELEAVHDAGVCPEVLPALYENVARAGYPEAARRAADRIATAARQAGIAIPDTGETIVVAS
jgi:hypothetical protein